MHLQLLSVLTGKHGIDHLLLLSLSFYDPCLDYVSILETANNFVWCGGNYLSDPWFPVNSETIKTPGLKLSHPAPSLSPENQADFLAAAFSASFSRCAITLVRSSSERRDRRLTPPSLPRMTPYVSVVARMYDLIRAVVSA